ncbi:reverse transcriptase/maturase family protein [Salinispora vitiensis]|uniref:reverse transcriptase/maturase family protein n=1 Tax=Salinispora vitiensis TaxID=999544 RepID=UPI001CC575C4
MHIPKNDGRSRPLGLPTWSDELVAEVVRLLLEAYYDVQFSDRSHGFRPGRGCHAALSEVVEVWKGTHWFIEGDIYDCSGSLDHQSWARFWRRRSMTAGSCGRCPTCSRSGTCRTGDGTPRPAGPPQGGVASRVLSNIYLDRLDWFVEQTLLPEYHQGVQRRRHRAYQVVVDNPTVVRVGADCHRQPPTRGAGTPAPTHR